MRKLHPHQEIAGLRGLTVEDFWIWAYSDLLTNVTRNAFAEFMVGFTLARLQHPRTGLEPSVFNYREKRVAVRAAAFTQSEAQTKKSKINFSLSLPKASGEETPATPDCMIFCLFNFEDVEDKQKARDSLINTEFWTFYVVPYKIIKQKAADNKTLGVTWMEANTPDGSVNFSQLKDRVDTVLELNK